MNAITLSTCDMILIRHALIVYAGGTEASHDPALCDDMRRILATLRTLPTRPVTISPDTRNAIYLKRTQLK